MGGVAAADVSGLRSVDGSGSLLAAGCLPVCCTVVGRVPASWTGEAAWTRVCCGRVVEVVCRAERVLSEPSCRGAGGLTRAEGCWWWSGTGAICGVDVVEVENGRGRCCCCLRGLGRCLENRPFVLL